MNQFCFFSISIFLLIPQIRAACQYQNTSLLHCIKCASSSRCQACEDGYYLKTSKLCEPCGYPCELCTYKTTTKVFNCTQCAEGYSLFDGNCIQCDESCLTCSGTGSNQCLSCYDGFYIYEEGDNKYCKSCSKGCLKCENENNCQQCDEGYYPNEQGDSCIECHKSCKTCHGTSENDCDTCKDGYFKSGNQCASCDLTKCKTCEITSDHCTACEDGKYVNDENKCVECGSNCILCESGSKCQKCENGYFLYNDKCDQCDSDLHCHTCSYDFSQKLQYCTSCNPGYYNTTTTGGSINLPSDGYFCNYCNVENCYYCKEAGKCEKCSTGYFLDGATCSKCDKTCLECEGSATSCTTCNLGYYSSGGKCIECPANCVDCNSNGCSMCKDGFYPSNDGSSCLTCHESCTKCHDGTNKCDECKIGYSFNNDKACVKCSENCDRCEGDKCIDCADEFYISDGKCSPCATVCFQCTGPTDNDCFECDPGYYFSKSFRKCFKCHEACKVCNGPNDYECSVCSPGYFMNVNENVGPYEVADKCSQCENGCLECSSLTLCTKCKDGYYIVEDDCYLCDIGCAKCTGSSQCTECLPGYYEGERNGNFVECASCPSNCKECNSNSECITCLDSYYKDETGKCQKCTYPCATCSSKDKCNSCANGYLLDDSNSCVSKCSTICESCEGSSSQCTSCHDGFMLSNNVCSPCPKGCKTCDVQDGVSVCTSCVDGYYKLLEECYPCDPSCKTCFGSSFGKCLSCSDGYYEFSRSLDPFYVSCRSCSQNVDYPNCALCEKTYPEVGPTVFTCNSCSKGFYLTGNNECSKCSSNCQVCTGDQPNNCLKCNPGYKLDVDSNTGSKSCSQITTVCEKCPPGCNSCSGDDCSYCEECNENHELNNGTCSTLNLDNCMLMKHCEKENTDPEIEEHVSIEQTVFDNFISFGNGGATYLSGVSTTVKDTEFKSCESLNGGGGAIYYTNEISPEPVFSLKNIKFENCEATYGGAVFIQTSSENCNVSVESCNFVSNKLNSKGSSKDEFYGGSALYIVAFDGNVVNCQFSHNVGKGGSLKVEQISKSDRNTLNHITKSLSISSCTFEIEKNSDCSLFLRQQRTEIKVNNCVFKGELDKNAYFIDGDSNGNHLEIKSCKFESDEKRALSKRLGESIKGNGLNIKKTTSIAWILFTTFVLTVAIAAALIKRQKLNNKIENNEDKEIKDQLNDSLIP